MCFGMNNHRFENTRRSMLALKLLEKLNFLAAVLQLRSTLITGK